MSHKRPCGSNYFLPLPEPKDSTIIPVNLLFIFRLVILLHSDQVIIGYPDTWTYVL